MTPHLKLLHLVPGWFSLTSLPYLVELGFLLNAGTEPSNKLVPLLLVTTKASPPVALRQVPLRALSELGLPLLCPTLLVRLFGQPLCQEVLLHNHRHFFHPLLVLLLVLLRTDPLTHKYKPRKLTQVLLNLLVSFIFLILQQLLRVNLRIQTLIALLICGNSV
ncbi:hypothetical protein NC652_037957 [Populus alba x Populus x berolinensis]|nr:hypothetical protein NC652_037957 [Populus alba x Populus x berolinensis]